MSRKRTQKGMEPASFDSDHMIDAEAIPGSEGGISDEETMKARGSDMPAQELENEASESVKRKRVSIEQGGMDEERAAREEVA